MSSPKVLLLSALLCVVAVLADRANGDCSYRANCPCQGRATSTRGKRAISDIPQKAGEALALVNTILTKIEDNRLGSESFIEALKVCALKSKPRSQHDCFAHMLPRDCWLTGVPFVHPIKDDEQYTLADLPALNTWTREGLNDFAIWIDTLVKTEIDSTQGTTADIMNQELRELQQRGVYDILCLMYEDYHNKDQLATHWPPIPKGVFDPPCIAVSNKADSTDYMVFYLFGELLRNIKISYGSIYN